MNNLLYFFIPVISYFTLVFIQKTFLKKQFIVKINNRSSHDCIATASGGISLFILVFLLSFIAYCFGIEYFDYSLLIPLSILTLIGLYDDVYDLDYKLKFIFQIIAAKIIIDNGLIIDNFHGILGIYELNRLVAQLFTIFIILAIINAINFSDGIDGLAITVVSLFVVAFEFFTSSSNLSPFSYLSIFLVLSILPLYYLNFRNNNKVFLGDAGSYFLGGVVAIYVISEEFDLNKILFVISILPYPIIDITRVFFLRIIDRKSPFIADKNHIHHNLFLKLKSNKMTVILIILSSISFTTLMQIVF